MAGEPFVKIWGSITKSSVWLEPHHVFKLWIYMLTEADKHGFVEGSKYAIGHNANLTPEETDQAFAKLEAPDPHSKSKEMDGRRLVPVDDGWVVVNKSKYRELRTPEQIATAERVRRHREKAAGEALHVTDVTASNSYPTSTSTSKSLGVGVQGKGDEPPADPVHDYCIRLTVAANKGLGVDPPRILWSSGSTRQAAEIVYNADIPIEFAEEAVLKIAGRCKTKDRVHALGYFTRGVIEAWERKDIADRVAKSKLKTADDRKPTRIADVVTPMVPVRFAACPECGRNLDEGQWADHLKRKHDSDAPFPES